MKKRKKGRKLNRTSDQRKALLRSLSRELFLREKIKTTEAKAKEFTSFAEKQITKAKSDSLSNIRLLSRHFSSPVVKKLTKEIAPRYKERKGGYTKITKLGFRKLDGAKMVIVELVK
jgi:large subunit ribosomal protein L17